MRQEGLRLSGKTVRRLMAELGLRPVQKGKRTYNSYRRQTSQAAPNILMRDFTCRGAYEKMVSDVTEFEVAGRKVYLSPLIDLFNGEVVGRSVSTSPTVDFVNRMFEGVAGRTPEGTRPVIHTDQGFQYWNVGYRRKLAELGARQSMSRKGDCHDNAPAESFFGHLKSEFFYRRKFGSVESFIAELNDYIDWYNNGRIRCDLGGMSPVEYRMLHQGCS